MHQRTSRPSLALARILRSQRLQALWLHLDRSPLEHHLLRFHLRLLLLRRNPRLQQARLSQLDHREREHKASRLADLQSRSHWLHQQLQLPARVKQSSLLRQRVQLQLQLPQRLNQKLALQPPHQAPNQLPQPIQPTRRRPQPRLHQPSPLAHLQKSKSNSRRLKKNLPPKEPLVRTKSALLRQ